MTYVLHAWESPIPRSLAEATALRDRLGGTADCASERLAQFIDGLLARYPCMTTLPPGRDDSVWSDGPMRSDKPGPVYSFGIRTQKLTAVVPFVVAAAQAANVVLMDEQAGVVYLPDGMALTATGRRRVELPDPAQTSVVPPKLEALQPARVTGSWYRLFLFLKSMVHAGDCERHIEWAATKDPVEWKAFADAHHYGHPYRDLELRGVNIDFSRFERFARRLNRGLRRSDLTSAAWVGGGELDEHTPRLVLPLEVRPEAIARVRPMVFDEAANQGLTVYDPQARLQVYPEGSYRINDEYVGLTDSGDPVSYGADHARVVMQAALQPMLARLGYRIQTEPYVTYRRDHDGVEHVIWPNMSNAGAQIKISITIRLRHEAWPALHSRWPLNTHGGPMSVDMHAPLMSLAHAAAFDQFIYRREEFHLYRDHHFQRLADWCETTLREHVEPMLARCQSLSALDEYLNSEGRAPAMAFEGRMPDSSRLGSALAIAHLAGCGRFDAVRDAVERFVASHRAGVARAGSALSAMELEWIQSSIARIDAARGSPA